MTFGFFSAIGGLGAVVPPFACARTVTAVVRIVITIKNNKLEESASFFMGQTFFVKKYLYRLSFERRHHTGFRIAEWGLRIESTIRNPKSAIHILVLRSNAFPGEESNKTQSEVSCCRRPA